MLLGHIRDIVPHRLARRVGVSPGDAAGLPPSVSLPTAIDSQSGQDCTGSYGKLVEPWCAARGITCAPISRRFAYTLGREITLADPTAPLVDFGANPADVIEGMRTFGVVPEAAYPGDDATVINLRIPFGTLEATWTVSDIVSIMGAGAGRCAAIRAQLAQSNPVGFGMSVDAAYEGLTAGSVYTASQGPSLGGHAQRIVGYRPGAFLVANSWGTGWADAGFGWLADEWIGGDECFDFYSLQFAPAVSS